MANNVYETFEYIEQNTSQNVANQIIVVQADGTFLSLNKTEPVFDVNPQQYYVDVGNSSQLMSVSDQLVMPDEENYLLNEANSVTNVQLADCGVQEPQILSNIDVPTATPVNVDNNCTQLTITSAQYQQLEQRGWVLFENNHKIYLLDNNMRLRDVTDNQEIIQKLRAVPANETPNGYTQSTISDFMQTGDETVQYNCSIQRDLVSEEIAEHINPQNLEMQPYAAVARSTEDETDEIIEEKVPDLMPAESDFLETTINELSEKYEKSDPRINSSTIKIKTKFALKDIPPEIVLGMTMNGKKLVARIAKPEKPVVEKKKKPKSDKKLRNINHKEYPQVTAFNPKIESLIQQAIKGQMITFSEEDAVKETDSVIQQLLRVPAFKPAVLERNLIITKVVIEDNDDGVKECEPVILPGRVVKGKEDTWVFQYISDMLQKINKDEINKKHKGGSNDINFLQIHVQEVTVDNEVARASISLHKRIILLKPKNIAQKVKVKEETQSAPKMQRKYACGACVQSFDTEYRLRVHQQVHCKERNDVRPLSAEQDVSYKMIKVGTRRQYVCTMCDDLVTLVY
ncbi:uncharacterized protein LOC126966227 isoform X3 [Leptidea sinapis]|uniref:uncharacterized protein LOC126966227 isoform X3 n=1 Tax=Leptidea sinapis TaxID=189913 RepID=UPI0021347B3B|nr:uncharacterized protein LOC126966227 isoform X3 [Leptidea sinapis]